MGPADRAIALIRAGIAAADRVHGGEQRYVDQRQRDRTVDDPLQVHVATFGEHPQPRLAINVDASDQPTHDRAVEQRVVFQIPMPPARIFRVGAMFENVVR